MNNITIPQIIDKYLQSGLDQELNSLAGKIEPEMSGSNAEEIEHGWEKWYPIDSTVTDAEIEQLENQLNCKLPTSYKIFLKHKHFYELYISEARFSGQEIRHWRRHLIDMAFNGYPKEFLIDKGYVPFADWSDWGLLCFDTNQKNKDAEYPIALWDHERCDEYVPFSDNFHNLLLKLDGERNNTNS